MKMLLKKAKEIWSKKPKSDPDDSEKDWLEAQKELVKSKSVGLNKQLLDASETDNLNKVKELISLGADIETKDNYGFTPLNNATRNGKLEVVKYLISVGADIETKNNDGNTPLDYKQDKIWSTKEIQELLIKQNPFNISLLKKHDIPIHPDIKEEHYDLDLGSELGTI